VFSPPALTAADFSNATELEAAALAALREAFLLIHAEEIDADDLARLGDDPLALLAAHFPYRFANGGDESRALFDRAIELVTEAPE